MESAAVMKRASCIVALLLLSLCSSSVALATPTLATNPNAYFDGSIHWQGSVTFHDASTTSVMDGHIDYAVFNGNSNFSSDYPGYGGGPVVYAYQIFVSNVGSDDISHLSVSLFGGMTPDIASNISSVPSTVSGFLGGSTPFNESLDPSTPSHLYTAANWNFTPTITPNGYSEILVFSSPYLPTWGSWGINDGGLADGYNVEHFDPVTFESLGTNLQRIPTPGSTPAPEPATVTLICFGGLLVATRGLVRRFRRRSN